jgi:hypothetical protein
VQLHSSRFSLVQLQRFLRLALCVFGVLANRYQFIMGVKKPVPIHGHANCLATRSWDVSGRSVGFMSLTKRSPHSPFFGLRFLPNCRCCFALTSWIHCSAYVPYHRLNLNLVAHMTRDDSTRNGATLQRLTIAASEAEDQRASMNMHTRMRPTKWTTACAELHTRMNMVCPIIRDIISAAPRITATKPSVYNLHLFHNGLRNHQACVGWIC